MGFRLTFWETHPPHSTPTSLVFFASLTHLPRVPYMLPYFFPSYISLAPSFTSPSPLDPRLSVLCLGSFTWLEERKGEERASLNYTCRQRSAPIQSGPTRCLPSRFTAFVSVASLYMYLLCLWLFYCLCVLCVVLFNHFIMFTVLIVQGSRLCLHCNQRECS